MLPFILGAIELARNQFPIPNQNCIWLCHGGHLGRGFPPEALSDLSVDLSGSDSRNRVGECALKIRFWAKYSFFILQK